MLKKIILIVISLFLALPVAANDTGSIVPVLLLFSQNGNKDVYEDILKVYKNLMYGIIAKYNKNVL